MSDSKVKYVWLNVKTWKFSNSWTEKEQEMHGEKVPPSKESEWKLIKFECVNDSDFEFHHLMRIA